MLWEERAGKRGGERELDVKESVDDDFLLGKHNTINSNSDIK